MLLLEPDYRVSFSLYNVGNYEQDQTPLALEEAQAICTSLISSITDYKPDVLSALSYPSYYDRYNFEMPFAELIRYAIIDRVNNIKEIQATLPMLFSSLHGKEEAAESLRNMLFFRERLRIGQPEWFIYPEVFFSTNFYKNYLENFSYILFESYEYDTSDQSLLRLPLFEPFNTDLSSYAQGIIPIHHLDASKCQLILTELPAAGTTPDMEVEMMRYLLHKSISKGYSMTLRNQID